MTNTATEAELKDRTLVPLNAAAKTLSLTPITLRKRMAEADIPEIILGPRKRCIMLAHLDELIADSARPAMKANNAI
jgi:hypothetical protein